MWKYQWWWYSRYLQINSNNIADAMGMLIKESTYGAFNANDQRTERFYIVKFLSTVYTLQHDELVDKETLKAGSLVTDAEYMSPAMKESL